MVDYNRIINKYYNSGSNLFRTLNCHSRSVADMALRIARDKALDLNPADIEAASMLHDVGIFLTNAPSIYCCGTRPYICHGILGAELLRKEGCPEFIARVAERHTGAGLTVDDIVKQHLPLPHADLLPETLLEKLICYADKFYSKSGDMKQKSLERVRLSMKAFGPDTAARFEQMHAIFG